MSSLKIIINPLGTLIKNCKIINLNICLFVKNVIQNMAQASNKLLCPKCKSNVVRILLTEGVSGKEWFCQKHGIIHKAILAKK